MARSRRLAALAFALVVSACGGGGSSTPPVSLPSASGVFSPTSISTVSLPGGPSLTAPAGAVASPVAVTIAETAEVPDAAYGAAKVYAFGPAGTTFAAPVEIRMPLPAGTTDASIWWSQQDGTYDSIEGTIAGGFIAATTTHFSKGFVGRRCRNGGACRPGGDLCRRGDEVCKGGPRCDNPRAEPPGTTCGDEQHRCDANAQCQPICVSGSACTPAAPDACRTYAKTCNDTLTAFTCDPVGAVLDGATCPAGVCSAGACVAPCVPGQSCSPASPDPCLPHGLTCNGTFTSGTCDPLAPLANGTSCADGKVCFGGECVPCSAGGACASANECHAAAYSCATGQRACVDTGDKANGSACTGGVCGNGTCNACTPGAPCPSGDPCKLAAEVCTTGFRVCAAAGNAPDGTACPAGACSAGTCVAFTSPPAVPSGVIALPGNGSTTLTWAPSAGATGYRVYHSSTPPVSTGSAFLATAAPQASIGSLPNGAVRYFAVSALNSLGESALSPTSCAAPTAADTTGLTLHDGLCGAHLDAARWPVVDGTAQNGAAARVSGGMGWLTTDVMNAESRTIRGTSYNTNRFVVSAGKRVTWIGAKVAVPAATASRSGNVTIRAAVRLTYQPPALRAGGFIDFTDVTVGLRDDGAGLHAFRQASHCVDSACATSSASGITFTDPVGLVSIASGVAGVAAAYDRAYTLALWLDETAGTIGIFHWSISGGTLGSALSGSLDLAEYVASSGGWSNAAIAGSGFNLAMLQVRAQDVSGGGTGTIAASFDDVEVGFDGAAPTLFDDFSGTGGNSGATGFSPAKWSAQGTRVLMLDQGSLLGESAIESVSTTAPTAAWHGLSLPDPASIGTLQVEAWVPTFESTGITTVTTSSVMLVGRFYRSGTSDVYAHLAIRASARDALFFIARCNDASCSSQTGIGYGELGSLDPAVRHVLRLGWDPFAKTLSFGVDGRSLTVNPKVIGPHVWQAAPYSGPASSPQRRIQTGLVIPAGSDEGATARVVTRVSNVFTSVTPFMSACNALKRAADGLMVSCMKYNPVSLAVRHPMGGRLYEDCAITQSEIDAGLIVYDAAQGAACLAASSTLTCSFLDSYGSWEGVWRPPPSCLAALIGQSATGSPCLSNYDCASGWCQNYDACPGTCVARGSSGAPCTGSETCAASLECDTGAFTCGVPGGPSEPCPCRPGLWCDRSGGTPVCRARRTSGACSSDDECAVGYLCANAICTPLAGIGQPCGAGAVCGPWTACVSGTCVSHPTTGQPCSGLYCADGFCDSVTQVCQEFRPLGASCTASQQCAGPMGWCDPGTGLCAPGYCAVP